MGNKPARNSSIHQPYNQMVEDAVSALKDRLDSTQNDVIDYLENKYEGRIPPRAKKNLETVIRSVNKTKNVATRRGAAGGRKVRFKAQLSGPVRRVRQPVKRLPGRRKLGIRNTKKKSSTLKRLQKPGASKGGGHLRLLKRSVRRISGISSRDSAKPRHKPVRRRTLKFPKLPHQRNKRKRMLV